MLCLHRTFPGKFLAGICGIWFPMRAQKIPLSSGRTAERPLDVFCFDLHGRSVRLRPPPAPRPSSRQWYVLLQRATEIPSIAFSCTAFRMIGGSSRNRATCWNGIYIMLLPFPSTLIYSSVWPLLRGTSSSLSSASEHFQRGRFCFFCLALFLDGKFQTHDVNRIFSRTNPCFVELGCPYTKSGLE